MPEPSAAGASVAKRPRRRPGENRERLLEAGIREFGTLGYHGTSTAAIAAAASVPQPHVYANFETKQDLFFACAERVCRDLAEPDRTAVQHRRFLLQAVAAAPRVELRERLAPLLLELREAMGERFDAALVDAAVSLME